MGRAGGFAGIEVMRLKYSQEFCLGLMSGRSGSHKCTGTHMTIESALGKNIISGEMTAVKSTYTEDPPTLCSQHPQQVAHCNSSSRSLSPAVGIYTLP